MPPKHHVVDLTVLAGLAGMTLFYAYDWYSASSHLLNVIMVLPLTALMLCACLLQFFFSARQKAAPAQDDTAAMEQVPIMVLFGLYVLSLNFLGFDLATFLFIAISLRLHGERRLLWLASYALVFSAATTFFFSAMLPYEMPLTFLGFTS